MNSAKVAKVINCLRMWNKPLGFSKKELETAVSQFTEEEWEYVSKFNKLPVNFIRAHVDKLNWFWLTRTHAMDRMFVTEFEKYLDIEYLKRKFK